MQPLRTGNRLFRNPVVLVRLLNERSFDSKLQIDQEKPRKCVSALASL
jgi:hypothetical protein